mgnify:CR=1 FL=1
MKYDLILSDPPWNILKGGIRAVRPRQSRLLDYPVLSIGEIRDIHRSFQSYAEENHLFFMWTIDKYLHESEQMMRGLGYKLHARMIWNKLNGVAPAFTLRYSHEYLLYMYYGKFTPVAVSERGRYTTVFEEKSGRHSRKPEISYAIMERLYPEARKLELFARYTRPGWDCWGNEIPPATAVKMPTF